MKTLTTPGQVRAATDHEARARSHRLRAWSTSPRAWALGVAALAFVVRLPLMLRRHEVLPGGDSNGYVQLAHDLTGPMSAVRPPGYPLFLALAGLLPGRLEDAAGVLQLLIGAAFAGAAVLFLWRIFGAIAAVVTGLLLALTPPGLYLDQVLLSDGLFGILVCVACAALVVAVLSPDRRLPWLAAFAVLAAAATYVKPVGHILVLAPVLPLYFATRSLRATVIGSGIVVVVVAALTIPWMVRNKVEFDSFTMSAQSGTTLFNRAFERDAMPVPTDQPEGPELQRFLDEHPGARPSSGFRTDLIERGKTPAEADAIQRNLALTAMRRNPGRLIEGVTDSIRAMYADVAADQRGIVHELIAERPSLIPRRITVYGLDLGENVRRMWRLCAFGGLATLLWFVVGDRRTRLAVTCVLATWVVVAFATAVMHGGQYRYSAALAPLLWLLGSAGLVTVLAVLGQALTPARRRQLVTMARAGVAVGRRGGAPDED